MPVSDSTYSTNASLMVSTSTQALQRANQNPQDMVSQLTGTNTNTNTDNSSNSSSTSSSNNQLDVYA